MDMGQRRYGYRLPNRGGMGRGNSEDRSAGREIVRGPMELGKWELPGAPDGSPVNETAGISPLTPPPPGHGARSAGPRLAWMGRGRDIFQHTRIETVVNCKQKMIAAARRGTVERRARRWDGESSLRGFRNKGKWNEVFNQGAGVDI